MKYIELLYAFELEAANLDKALSEKISSLDILYWLNQGVNKFIKTRYSGHNISLTAFEQDEKRSRDLINLYTTYSTTPTGESEVGYTSYVTTYPEDLFVVLDESVEIADALAPTELLPANVFECTADNYMYRITNGLTDFHWRNGKARPLRVRTKTGCALYTDGKYIISKYKINYLRNPSTITMIKPFEEYTEFPEYSHNEIVKLAVQMYLESVSSPRYKTIDNEVHTME